MNIGFCAIDIFICVVVFLSFIIGWVRGATKEILSVVAWVGGIYLTIAIFPYAQEFARNYISHKLIADFVTACCLFILFLTLLSIFNYFCSNLVKKSILNVTDKALGGIFGIVRGILILSVIDLAVNKCMLNEPLKFVEDSKLKPVVSYVTNFVILVLPEDLQNKLLSHMSQISKQSIVGFIKDGIVDKLASEEVAKTFDQTNKNNVIADGTKNNEEQQDDEFIEEDDVPVNNVTQSAEELATLKPKKVQVEKKTKTLQPKSRNDMDRLLSQYDDID